MLNTFINLIPVILIFIFGFVLRKINFFKKEDGDFFLKIVFYLAAPALILLSVTKIQLQANLIVLPVVPFLVFIIMYFVAKYVGKYFNLPRQTLGAFLVGVLIVNLGFMIPFVLAAFHEGGIARLTLMDFGNGILTFTLIYLIACKYGDKAGSSKVLAKKIFFSVPIWALLVGIIMNLCGIKFSGAAENFLQMFANLTSPFIMLALGIYFTPKIILPKAAFAGIAIRMVGGFLLGFIIVKIFGIEGFNRLIILSGCAAPIGYNTLTFSSMENLDKEFAAGMISYSVLAGMILMPILLYILQ
ncbi:MAG: AEC family transporter [Parcubacteria group bacterium]